MSTTKSFNEVAHIVEKRPVEPCKSDPERWYPGMFNKASKGALNALVDDVKAVVAICESCPFQALCLNEGMKGENVDYGIWGGKLAAQRQMEQGWSHENIAWGSLCMAEWRLLGIIYPHLKTWADGIYRGAPVPRGETL